MIGHMVVRCWRFGRSQDVRQWTFLLIVPGARCCSSPPKLPDDLANRSLSGPRPIPQAPSATPKGSGATSDDEERHIQTRSVSVRPIQFGVSRAEDQS